MFNGCLSVSSIVVLWLKLEYFYFSYLIRIVIFSTGIALWIVAWYCWVKFSCSFCCCDIFWSSPLFFHSLWSDLFYNVDVCTFCWVLTLWYFVLYCEEGERKPTRCNNQMFIINTVWTCLGHRYAQLQENKDLCYCMWCAALVLLDVVGSGCGVRALWRWA